MVNTAVQPQALANILAGQLATVTLAPGDSRFCQLPDTIIFDSATSFIDSSRSSNITAYQTVLTRLASVPPGENLLVVGHTDDVGQPGDNDPLSERRAASALAVLQGNTSVWESNYRAERSGAWSDDNFRTMLLEATGTTPSAADIRQHKEISAAGEALRVTLFTQYFQKLLSNPASPPSISTLVPADLGCGERHTLATGNHEPSRRAEFFFFRGTTSPTVNCGEYPRWITPCRILPVGPPTVAIAPVETIRVGGIERVQVTVTPSPLPLGATVTLELSTATGTGGAEFVATGANTLELNSSQQVRIRGVTVSSEIDNIHITARFTGQATILAQEDVTVVGAVSIFLRFEVWNLSTRSFEPLPANIDVDIVDEDLTALSNDILATEQTDANGRVFFNLSALTDPDEAEPDIFFLVHTNGLSHAGHTLPSEWSTSGWLATDGITPGLHNNFIGTQLGTPTTPLVFRVGLDFHAKLEYHVDGGGRTGSDDPAPPQVLTKLMQEETGPDTELLVLRTNNDGELHGVSFEAEPSNTFYLHVDFEMQDSSINLERTRITTSTFFTLTWDSVDTDSDRKVFASHRATSIGTHTSPELFSVTINNRNVALYQLKVLRELGAFLFEITDTAWTGVELRVFPHAPAQAFSWPPGQLNLPSSSQWNRETIIHETAHQVMWKEASVDASDIAGLFIGGIAGFDLLHGCHTSAFLANERHALIEGWAEFIAAIFEGSGTPPYRFTDLVNCTTDIVLDPTDPDFPIRPCSCLPFSPNKPLGPGGGAPNNQGQQVEGAFANGLWGVFKNHVVSSVDTSAPIAQVPERAKEQVTVDAPWVSNSSVQQRFLSMIWQPLGSLSSTGTAAKTTGRMLDAIRSANQATVWHQLLPELQAFNMALRAPSITVVDPGWGPITGGAGFGHQTTITGADFVAMVTVPTSGGSFSAITAVEFDSIAAPTVTVTAGNTLVVAPPAHAAGLVDVKITTPGGSTTLANAYIYVDDPLMIDDVQHIDASGTVVTNTSGDTAVSTAGGDKIEITGQGFFSEPDAEVIIDGNAIDPAKVEVISPNTIRAETPAIVAGSVIVDVRSPDGTIASWANLLRYANPPRVIDALPRTGPAASSTNVVVTGLNFQPDIRAETPISSLLVNRISASQIEVTMPASAPGLVLVDLINPSDGLSDSFEFFYEDPIP